MKTKFKVTRQQLSTRGGGIEIDLTPFGFDNEFMTAYQNYLGGGMLGKIANDCTYPNWRNDVYLLKIAEELRQYLFELTNEDEYIDYDDNQSLPVSAY